MANAALCAVVLDAALAHEIVAAAIDENLVTPAETLVTISADVEISNATTVGKRAFHAIFLQAADRTKRLVEIGGFEPVGELCTQITISCETIFDFAQEFHVFSQFGLVLFHRKPLLCNQRR
jgi:hypothetical protein